MKPAWTRTDLYSKYSMCLLSGFLNQQYKTRILQGDRYGVQIWRRRRIKNLTESPKTIFFFPYKEAWTKWYICQKDSEGLNPELVVAPLAITTYLWIPYTAGHADMFEIHSLGLAPPFSYNKSISGENACKSEDQWASLYTLLLSCWTLDNGPA